MVVTDIGIYCTWKLKIIHLILFELQNLAIHIIGVIEPSDVVHDIYYRGYPYLFNKSMLVYIHSHKLRTVFEEAIFSGKYVDNLIETYIFGACNQHTWRLNGNILE